MPPVPNQEPTLQSSRSEKEEGRRVSGRSCVKAVPWYLIFLSTHEELQEKARESDACTILRYRHRGCAGTTRTDGCSRMRSWPAPARWIKQQKVRRPVPGPGQAPATLDLTSRSESSHRSAASFLIHLGAGPNSPNPNATPW